MARNRGYQRHKRFTKRLEVSFSAGGMSFKGILSNLSATGLFIRTNRGFAPGTVVDIQLILPDNRISSLRGIVKRTIKVPVTPARNGMGVELVARDEAFLDFVATYFGDQEVESEEPPVVAPFPEYEVIACSECGVKNKVSRDNLSRDLQCGRCGTQLTIDTV